jgi:hypothetical protein
MTNKNALLMIAVALSASVSVNAQAPFIPGTNVALAKPGTNSAAKVYTIYTSTVASSAAFTPGVTFNPTYNINGVGLNQSDNLLYGAAFTGNTNNFSTAFDVSLFRIGSDGVTVDLGKLPVSGAAGSGAMEFVNFSAGTVATNGSYYYMTYALTSAATARTLNRIGMGEQPDLTSADMRMFVCWKSGVSTLPSNPGGSMGTVTGFYELDFSNPDMTSSFNAFLTQVNANYPNVFNSDGGVQDFAINPIDSKIYGYISWPDSSGNTVGRPVVVGTPVASMAPVTPVGTVVNTQPGQEAAGVQFSTTGNLYALFTTGHFAQVDLTTGALSGLTMSNLTTSGGNLRGDLAPAVNATPLPVKLVSFTGKNVGASNELTWVTATEENNKGFAVERSEDQKSWSSIGNVNSKAVNGNSSERLTYSFTDNGSLANTEYYRLKQTDFDGKVIYSVAVAIQSKNAGTTVNIYPNPASESIKINGVTKGNTIRIADLSGKVVLTQTAQDKTSVISLSGLSKNMYFVQVVENGNVIYTGKVIKNSDN